VIEKWTDLKDPIVWAERMWNHSNEMLSATTNRGINWPRLSERDIVDLLTFLSKLPDVSVQEAAFYVGDPGWAEMFSITPAVPVTASVPNVPKLTCH
jgi:hypothetical protein